MSVLKPKVRDGDTKEKMPFKSSLEGIKKLQSKWLHLNTDHKFTLYKELQYIKYALSHILYITITINSLQYRYMKCIFGIYVLLNLTRFQIWNISQY